MRNYITRGIKNLNVTLRVYDKTLKELIEVEIATTQSNEKKAVKTAIAALPDHQISVEVAGVRENIAYYRMKTEDFIRNAEIVDSEEVSDNE